MVRSILLIAFFPLFGNLHAENLSGQDPDTPNPILPGYYADPSIVSSGGSHFIYATLDPWGGDRLGCWESRDFKNWTFHSLNWPTKSACTSPDSTDAMVWAPSVVKAPDGKFRMYVSVGSEVWAGIADAPLGPWRDANGGKPLIPGKYKPGFHMIDAEAFIDADGQAYLYWGSGLNWVNGKCWAVKLKPDMVTFDGEVRDVTPENYFEGPVMVRHGGKYYLTYSNGKTIEDNYQVHYAIGDGPFGPFTEASNSPILVTDKSKNIISPGHHAVFEKDGRHFILYHRHSIPFRPEFVGRQVCVDEMTFSADGLIGKVSPTHEGPEFIRRKSPPELLLTASSQRDAETGAPRAADNNHATLWVAAEGATEAWLQAGLGGEPRAFTRNTIRFEYAWKSYAFELQASDDGTTWKTIADHSASPATGSPVVVDASAKARYLRIVFPKIQPKEAPGIFEWTVE
jgi:hypothetical protein